MTAHRAIWIVYSLWSIALFALAFHVHSIVGETCGLASIIISVYMVTRKLA